MTTPITRPVAINLRYLRKRKKYSLRKLAAESGIPKSTISDIELDKCPDPGVYTLRALVKVLGCSVDTLLTTDLRPDTKGGAVEMVTVHFGEQIDQ